MAFGDSPYRTTDYRRQTTAIIMYYKFEKLNIWQLARTFTSKIYKATENYPKNEIFGLTSQIRRASISVMLNIAEGSDRNSDADFKRFLTISLASLEEVVAGLYIPLDQQFINNNEFTTLYEDSHLLASKIKAFIRFLSNSCSQ